MHPMMSNTESIQGDAKTNPTNPPVQKKMGGFQWKWGGGAQRPPTPSTLVTNMTEVIWVIRVTTHQ